MRNTDLNVGLFILSKTDDTVSQMLTYLFQLITYAFLNVCYFSAVSLGYFCIILVVCDNIMHFSSVLS